MHHTPSLNSRCDWAACALAGRTSRAAYVSLQATVAATDQIPQERGGRVPDASCQHVALSPEQLCLEEF
jgi:hypothetical protein